MTGNDIINAALAIAFMVSPTLFHKSGSDQLHKMYRDAQKQAEYIVATGDISQVQALMKEDAGMQPLLNGVLLAALEEQHH